MNRFLSTLSEKINSIFSFARRPLVKLVAWPFDLVFLLLWKTIPAYRRIRPVFQRLIAIILIFTITITSLPPGQSPSGAEPIHSFSFDNLFIFLSNFSVYLLKSLKDGKFYIGQTDNIERRLNEHNSGFNISTKYRRPFSLIGYKTFKTQKEARWYEYEVKHHSDKKKKFIVDLRFGEPQGSEKVAK
ncbi:MAG: putative endonuclease [Microgenomates group bacterium Gr01-1014_5]|nr:MAG: putative endonuclease [Microgenomates group bacterium Gr01-1014_5]